MPLLTPSADAYGGPVAQAVLTRFYAKSPQTQTGHLYTVDHLIGIY